MSPEKNTPQKANWVLGIGAIVVLLLLAALGLSATKLPEPQPATVAPSVFSSARALSYLRQIARAPHAIGTEENAKVREYIVGELKALGLQPEIQTGMGRMTTRPWGTVGIANNIVVRIPGTAAGASPATTPRKALLLAAHYDSVPTGPGAADDGASVSAILEVLHALKAGEPLQNDLICLFTDGEEAGLLGSDLFVSSHPWAKDVGLALNFEYRGNSGPMLMFETSVGNGKLISAFAKTVAHPVANSLLYEVYKVMPNDTDMTSFKRAGVPGMNFAAIENPVAYHLQIDSIDNLDERTLQQQGDIMLAVTRHFGNASLDDLKSPDSVYFDLPGLGLVHYTVTAVIPLTLFIAAVFCFVAVIGIRGGELRPGRILLALPVFLLTAILLGIGCQLLWGGVSMMHPEYGTLGDPYNSQWYLLAYVALVIGCFIAIKAVIARWFKPLEFGFGALLLWVLLLVVCSFAMPGATFMFAWPLLAMLVALGALFSKRLRSVSPGARAAILVLGLAPCVIMFAPLIRNLFIGLGPQVSIVTGVVIALVAGIMTPLFTVLTRRFLLPALPLAAGAVFLVVGSMTAKFDAAHPHTDNLFYAWDSSSGKAFWISRDAELDAWSKPYFLSVSDKRQVPEIFGAKSQKYWVSPAPQVDGLEAPDIQVSSDTTNGAIREIAFKVKTVRHAPIFSVKVEGTDVLASRVEGQPFSHKPNPKWLLEAYGMGERTLDVAVQVKAGQPFNIRVSDETYGLPQNGVALRPASLIQSIYGTNSDTIRAVRVKSFN